MIECHVNVKGESVFILIAFCIPSFVNCNVNETYDFLATTTFFSWGQKNQKLKGIIST
jgi:hypothetical protein